LEGELSKLDVIVVNDGSTDGTLEIAENWKKKYPGDITIIDKPNGGHGSTINEALMIAKGKYFRVLDGDDWLNVKTIKKYLETLEASTEDLIITNYTYNYTANNTKETVNSYETLKNITTMEELSNLAVSDHDFISQISIHSCTVKTEALRKIWDKGLLEKTFYEDQQFVAKVIFAAESIKAYDLDVYQYMIGRNEQSMSKDKMFLHREDHGKVLLELVKLAESCDNPAKKKILSRRNREIYKTHYWIYFYHPGLTRKEKDEFKKLDNILKKHDHEISDNVDERFKLQLFLGRYKAMLK
jgi:glycosyltransferase involved in cell wall biosynthesis